MMRKIFEMNILMKRSSLKNELANNLTNFLRLKLRYALIKIFMIIARISFMLIIFFGYRRFILKSQIDNLLIGLILFGKKSSKKLSILSE
jgi:hypothetical protein